MRPSTEPQRPRVQQAEERGRWLLCDDLTVLDGMRRWTIPAGFTFDYASVPRIARWLIETTALGTSGVAAHDALYQRGGRVKSTTGECLHYNREDGDSLFRGLMEQDRVPRLIRWAAHRAVRRFGWTAWQEPNRQPCGPCAGWGHVGYEKKRGRPIPCPDCGGTGRARQEAA